MREQLEGALKVKVRRGKICLGGARLEKVNDLKIDYSGDIPVAFIELDVRIKGLDFKVSDILNEKSPYEKSPYDKLNELRFGEDGVYIDEELIRYIRKVEIVSEVDDRGYSKVRLEVYINDERVIV